MSVFVLDQRKQPLMPCLEKRARLLLERGKAVAHWYRPFPIRLKARSLEHSQVQAVVLKLDLGSKTTWIVLVRVEQGEEGDVHHVLQLANLSHRGQ